MQSFNLIVVKFSIFLLNVGIIYQAVPIRHPRLSYPLPPKEGEAHGEMVTSLVKKLVTGRVTPAILSKKWLMVPGLNRGKNGERKEGRKHERKTWTLRKENKSHSHPPCIFPVNPVISFIFLTSTHIHKERKKVWLILNPTMRPTSFISTSARTVMRWFGPVQNQLSKRGEAKGLALFTQLPSNRASRGLAFEPPRSLFPFSCLNWQKFEIPFLMLAYANVFLSLKSESQAV